LHIGLAAIVFTDDIKELITGMILGDGNLRMIGKEGRLQIEQKDREFYNSFGSSLVV